MLNERDSSFNYAAYNGIHKSELAAAIIFTLIYVPLFILYILRSIKQPTYVFRVLVVFSLARIIAFALRATLAGSESAGENINVVIAQMIIYSVGFSALLYSSYTLVLDRHQMANTNGRHDNDGGPLAIAMRLLRNRHIFRLACTAAIVLGIIGGVNESDTGNQDDLNLGNSLRKVSLYIFLVLVCCILLVTFGLLLDERRANLWTGEQAQFGRKNGTIVLLAICTMFIIREAFSAATIGDVAEQNKPSLFYTLVAGTELICVILFLVPGLVPTREELKAGAESGWAQTASSSEIPLNGSRV